MDINWREIIDCLLEHQSLRAIGKDVGLSHQVIHDLKWGNQKDCRTSAGLRLLEKFVELKGPQSKLVKDLPILNRM